MDERPDRSSSSKHKSSHRDKDRKRSRSRDRKDKSDKKDRKHGHHSSRSDRSPDRDRKHHSDKKRRTNDERSGMTVLDDEDDAAVWVEKAVDEVSPSSPALSSSRGRLMSRPELIDPLILAWSRT